MSVKKEPQEAEEDCFISGRVPEEEEWFDIDGSVKEEWFDIDGSVKAEEWYAPEKEEEEGEQSAFFSYDCRIARVVCCLLDDRK